MFQSGILDRARLLSNVLMLLLLCGNIYFSTQFIANLSRPAIENQENVTLQIKSARFLKTFINKVLNTQGTVSFEDRVQLENELLQIHDPVLTTVWNDFVTSKTSKDGQTNAVKLMALLVDRI